MAGGQGCLYMSGIDCELCMARQSGRGLAVMTLQQEAERPAMAATRTEPCSKLLSIEAPRLPAEWSCSCSLLIGYW